MQVLAPTVQGAAGAAGSVVLHVSAVCASSQSLHPFSTSTYPALGVAAVLESIPAGLGRRFCQQRQTSIHWLCSGCISLFLSRHKLFPTFGILKVGKILCLIKERCRSVYASVKPTYRPTDQHPVEITSLLVPATGLTTGLLQTWCIATAVNSC